MAAGRFATLTSLRPALIDWPRKLAATNWQSEGSSPLGGPRRREGRGPGARCRCPHRQAAEAKTPL